MTTFTTVHVYQLSAAVYAAYRNDRPFVRPQRIRDEEGQLAWRGWRRVVPMAPLVASFVIPRGASDDDIRREVAYLALTEWDSTGIEVAVDPKTSSIPGYGAALSPAATPITAEELAAAERRADAEAALDAATTLDDAAAIRWLDGDRSDLPQMLALAEAARVRAFGVYAGVDELLETVVLASPLPMPDAPSVRPPAPPPARGLMEWPGIPQSAPELAVRRGFARYVDPLQHVVELTPAGHLAALTRSERGRVAQALERLLVGPLRKEQRVRGHDGSIRSAWTCSSSPAMASPASTLADLEVSDYEVEPVGGFDESEDGGDMLRRMLARYSGEHVAAELH